MIKLKGKFALFCDYALISQDGKLSIIGEFDHLFTTQEKAVLGRGFLVSKIRGEGSKEVEIVIKIIHQGSNQVVFDKKLGIKLDPGGNALIILEFNGFTFNEEGVYRAQVMHLTDTLSEASIHVSKVSKPKAAQA
jgi:hypothetical protein